MEYILHHASEQELKEIIDNMDLAEQELNKLQN